MPLGSNGEDFWIWPYTQSGAYTVKSGTMFLEKEKQCMYLDVVEVNDRNNIIWKIKTVPKIKFFLWRALSGALDVADRLHSRGMSVPLSCQLCSSSIETISHMMFECQVARQILVLAVIPLPDHGFGNCIEDNVDYMLELMEKKDLSDIMRQSIPWVLWTIWKNQNSIVIAKTQRDMGQLVLKAQEEAASWFNLNAKVTEGHGDLQRTFNEEVRWTKPREGMSKCNVSSSWVNDNSLFGGAWILRDHMGNALLHSRDVFLATNSRMIVELKCILWALQCLRDNHY